MESAATHDRDLLIPLILGVVLIILGLLLRAIVAPLMLIATVVLSFGAAPKPARSPRPAQRTWRTRKAGSDRRHLEYGVVAGDQVTQTAHGTQMAERGC